ncbi:hypothetical protein BKA65DRAFT_557593 [Rhexocercosporidium sp. MPI-PUGE-AT-0058]|nr:hypothetical protein BKA65DRAFT_557593 [Rhexocercosporidium sp. MPI-PUGE-AT-0058]
MFRPRRAQIAVDLSGQYLNSKVDSVAHDIAADVDSLDNCCLDGSHYNNQETLLSILRAAEALPRSASPLVRLLIPRILSPSLDLIETIVNIFCKANKPRQALSYLANQIKACHQQSQTCHDRSNEPSFMFLHFKKLHVARKHYYLSYRHITALQTLLPILEDRLGPMDIQNLEIKRELSLVMFDRGDKEHARLLYQEAVMISEERNGVGNNPSEEKHGTDRMSGGVGDKWSHSQVKDHDNESLTRWTMVIKSTLRAWDKRLTEREEVIRKRAALLTM